MIMVRSCPKVFIWELENVCKGLFCGLWISHSLFILILSELRHSTVLKMAGLLLFEGSGANLGIRMSWKTNVTVHLPCISILAPRTSHQTLPSKSSARADSHAATARTSVELWQLARVCTCVHVHSCVCLCVFASRQCVRPPIPANTDS